MRFLLLMALASTWCGMALLADDRKGTNIDFEDTDAGKLPDGWSAQETGTGSCSVWKIVEDDSSPKGNRVLAQQASNPTGIFNLCVFEDAMPADVVVSVAFKAVGGKIDQGGGIMWRCRDENNYYVARYNPLESNLRAYKVVDGKRTQLATKEDLKAPAEKWHTLSVRMKGNAIECSLNGNRELALKDDTFREAGQIGLWTKADAKTYFDQLEVRSLK